MFNLNYVINFSSCGYFCLKHILKKEKTKMIKKGYMSLNELKNNLSKFNYYCLGCKVRSLENVKCSCVTLLNLKNSLHYVIIKKIDNRFVYVYDPLFLFVRKIKKDKFMRKWSKICLFYKKI